LHYNTLTEMADISTCPPLTRSSVQAAHEKIKEHVHLTPVLTSRTLNNIASTPQSTEALKGTTFEGSVPAKPRIRFFFKCENFQRIGAFKVRGAFHALSRVPEDVRQKGIVTHSSGNPFSLNMRLALISR
jgi:threonine dehydratase